MLMCGNPQMPKKVDDFPVTVNAMKMQNHFRYFSNFV